MRTYRSVAENNRFFSKNLPPKCLSLLPHLIWVKKNLFMEQFVDWNHFSNMPCLCGSTNLLKIFFPINFNLPSHNFILHILYVHTHTYMSRHTHTYEQTHTHTSRHTHTYEQTHTHTHTHTHIRADTHTHTNRHTHMNRHTHIRTHTHTKVMGKCM